MNAQILTIGFDGPNRAGKGTQCQRLHQWFYMHKVPALIIRGAGSRRGLGNSLGDPESEWWQDINKWIHTPKATYDDWDTTSERLARELIVWRDRILPNYAKQQEEALIALIVDRTILSRTMTIRARQIPDVPNNLYPNTGFRSRNKITPEAVCPDIIFNIIAQKETLLSRLCQTDPKYTFRKKLIEETADWFGDAAEFIPAPLRERVVEIDGSASEQKVFLKIESELKQRFPSLKDLSS